MRCAIAAAFGRGVEGVSVVDPLLATGDCVAQEVCDITAGPVMKSPLLFLAALAACSAVLADARAQEPERLSYGSRAGMDVMIIGKTGIGTSKAVIRIKLTRENAAEFCEFYLNDTSAACAKKVQKEDGARLRPSVSGNCRKRSWTDMYGVGYVFKGRNKNKSDDNIADYLIVNSKTGEVLDGFSPSGYGVALGVFQALCPGVAP